MSTPLIAIDNFCTDYYTTYCNISPGGSSSSYPQGSIISLKLLGLGTSGNGFGSADWEWEKEYGGFTFVSDNGGIQGYPQNNGDKSIGSVANFELNASGQIQFKVRARNSCGWGEWKYVTWDVNVYGARSAPYTYYPNPASSELIVDNNPQEPDDKAKKSNTVYNDIGQTGNAHIYDMDGNEVITTGYSPEMDKIRLNVSELPMGNYFLRIHFGEMDNTHQIIIER